MLMLCGGFYMCLSIWGILQMLMMGVAYNMEATNLIEDTEAHHFDDVYDFIDKTRENYKICARNCYIAAGLYVLVLISTYFCISKAKRDAKKREEALLNEDLLCTVEEKELTEKQKRKIL